MEKITLEGLQGEVDELVMWVTKMSKRVRALEGGTKVIELHPERIIPSISDDDVKLAQFGRTDLGLLSHISDQIHQVAEMLDER